MTRKVFSDETNEGQELELFVNDKGRCFIQAGNLRSDGLDYTGWITLDLDDLNELISELQIIKKQMQGNG